MSLERIHEIIKRIEAKPYNEAVKLSQNDWNTLNSQSQVKRGALLKSLGKFDSEAQKADDAYNDFFSNSDMKHDVEFNHHGDSIKGDENFYKLYPDGIENQIQVTTFLIRFHDIATNSFRIRFNDLRVSRGDRVTLHVKTVDDTTFQSDTGEFLVIVQPSTTGRSCKVESINFHGLMTTAGRRGPMFISAVDKDPKIASIKKNTITRAGIIEFK